MSLLFWRCPLSREVLSGGVGCRLWFFSSLCCEDFVLSLDAGLKVFQCLLVALLTGADLHIQPSLAHLLAAPLV